MNKFVFLASVWVLSTSVQADNWRFSGYTTFGDIEANGSDITASLEGYYHSQNRLGRLTLMGEIDSARIGNVQADTTPFQVTQFGVAQRFPLGEQAAITLGYQNLFGFGESLENRPSIALQYVFQNGMYLSHRTRYHHTDYKLLNSTTRLDNVIGYQFNGYDAYFQHIHFTTEERDDFQLRLTKLNETFSPFVELRTQQDREYSAFVVGVNLNI
ncbi:hypothetical protein ACP3VU_06630 [Vibrio sp. PNB23_22_6]|uniref:hypothetical protein n=1 Tax=Vibrio TaxID=662 RepID=UPI00406844E2